MEINKNNGTFICSTTIVLMDLFLIMYGGEAIAFELPLIFIIIGIIWQHLQRMLLILCSPFTLGRKHYKICYWCLFLIILDVFDTYWKK
jgi:hypothetical protein